MPRPDELLYAMRTGSEQPEENIRAFVRGIVDGSVSRPQAAAWLAWAYQRGLGEAETVALTRAMTESGTVLRWGEGPALVDKHSTGGVGDKVSLVLAPLWAELGYRVPMISGRGLGHTGGTLDKLESIEGFRTDLGPDKLSSILGSVGCFITGQTEDLAPADRILYALRNETCTVESIPLIVGSILSKKLASGIRRLVLDVKTGSGAFMQRTEDARARALALVRVAQGSGLPCHALLTDMDTPLGHAVGNTLEVKEAMDTLEGRGPADLRDLTLALADDPRAAEVLASGAAAERFRKMISAQGGRPGMLKSSGCARQQVRAYRSGIVRRCDARAIARAAFALGAGRLRADDPIDPGVGVELVAKRGDPVKAGGVLAVVVHRAGRALEEASRAVREAYEIGDGPPRAIPLVLERVTG
jgi:pyrimidine-nucleoside phosphorylase